MRQSVGGAEPASPERIGRGDPPEPDAPARWEWSGTLGSRVGGHRVLRVYGSDYAVDLPIQRKLVKRQRRRASRPLHEISRWHEDVVIEAGASAKRRTPLSRERVLQAAVDLADRGGIEALSMRKLGQDLTVEAMALYRHVRNKHVILDGSSTSSRARSRRRPRATTGRARCGSGIVAARQVMLRHPWAPRLLEERNSLGPAAILGLHRLRPGDPPRRHHLARSRPSSPSRDEQSGTSASARTCSMTSGEASPTTRAAAIIVQVDGRDRMATYHRDRAGREPRRRSRSMR